MFGIKVRAGGQLSPRQKGRQRPLFLFSTLHPQSHRAGRQVPYLRLHQLGSHCLPHPIDLLRLCLSQLIGLPKLLTVAFSYESLVFSHASQLPKIFQTSKNQTQQAPSPCTCTLMCRINREGFCCCYCCWDEIIKYFYLTASDR